MTAPSWDFPEEHYHDADLRLARLVPDSACDILDLECGEGWLGELLKHSQPKRRITGIEKCRERADAATTRIDTVLTLDIERENPPFGNESFDCIVADQLFARYADPRGLLERLRPWLRPGGCLIAPVSNPMHWSRVDALLRGEAAWTREEPMHGISECIRIFLDAGYLPRVADLRNVEAPAGWLMAAQSFIARQRLDLERFADLTQTWQCFFSVQPIEDIPVTEAVRPVSVGVCTNDPVVLRENLLLSPCLRDEKHEILRAENAASAAEGLNAIIAQAKHELIVLVHQDVYLPVWWIARLWQQYERTRRATGDKVGVMGVFGVSGPSRMSGRVCDRFQLLDHAVPLPSRVKSLDELVLIVPKNTPLRFDPALGFHLYGTDICLAAEAQGLHGLVIDAPCHHNARLGKVPPAAFETSKAILRGKWPGHLPVATPCAIVT